MIWLSSMPKPSTRSRPNSFTCTSLLQDEAAPHRRRRPNKRPCRLAVSIARSVAPHSHTFFPLPCSHLCGVDRLQSATSVPLPVSDGDLGLVMSCTTSFVPAPVAKPSLLHPCYCHAMPDHARRCSALVMSITGLGHLVPDPVTRRGASSEAWEGPRIFISRPLHRVSLEASHQSPHSLSTTRAPSSSPSSPEPPLVPPSTHRRHSAARDVS